MIARVYKNRLTFGVLSLLLLSGCNSVAPFNQPEVATKNLENPDYIAERYHIDTQWWKQYNNPELNALIETAFANNIDVKQSVIALQQMLYQSAESDVRLLPSFSGSLSASRSYNFRTEQLNSPSYGVQLGMSYELDLWKKLATAKTATDWAVKASQADIDNLRLTVINQVVNSYFQLCYLKENYEINQKNLKRYQKLQDIASAKYEYGKTSVMPYLQAKQSYLGLQARLLSLRDSYRQTEQRLKNLLNKSADESLDLALVSINDVHQLGVDLSVPLSVLANRPDLKASLARLQSVYYRQQSQKRAWYPNVSLTTGISSNSEQLGKVLSLPIGSASVSVNLPFLQWQTLELQDKQAQANFDNAKLSFEKALTTALNEVDERYHRYQSTKQQLALTQEKYRIAKKSSNFYQAEYELGKSGLSQYLGALNTLDSTKNDLLNQRHELLRAEIAVYQAMAGKFQN